MKGKTVIGGRLGGMLDKYIKWYTKKRIKLSLGGMSPLDYRMSLGLVFRGPRKGPHPQVAQQKN